ncbi:hypothetical protein RRG08_049926 [Elysia crispata]|uniref:Uncharacterized protein n=1 Tax=Elysia crispata TaxID=231223 RepID=A0AAE1CQ38_9GAST|nr:hypothetical protein RRG08_049926 [Elysia crispata]
MYPATERQTPIHCTTESTVMYPAIVLQNPKLRTQSSFNRIQRDVSSLCSAESRVIHVATHAMLRADTNPEGTTRAG